MARKALTDLAVKAFVKANKPESRITDGEGLFLHIRQGGQPTWRIRYRYDGKAKVYTVGPYPAVSLQKARQAVIEVKHLLSEGSEPVIARKVKKAKRIAEVGTTFEDVARTWLASKKSEWSEIHYQKSTQAFERDVFPFIGSLPISDITPAIASKPIEEIKKRGCLETASRILQHLNGVFRFAQAKGIRQDNPAAPVRELLPRKRSTRHMRAFLTFGELGDLLKKAEVAHLSPTVRMAHRLLAFTAMRIGNIVEAEWKEFDLDSEVPVWTIPREKMKIESRENDHRVPLCTEIANELRKWKVLNVDPIFLFPGRTRQSHISRESLEKVYRETLGLRKKHSPHGWRGSFSTLARDNGFDRDVVEIALDHAHDNETARAYDHGERFEQRVALYRWWGRNLSNAEGVSRTFTKVA